MKIGIDCRLWSETGVGRYIRNLVKNLQVLDKKNKYVLFALPKNREKILKQAFEAVSPQAESVQNDNFKVVEVDIYWHTLEEQVRLPQVINQENLDLMHFPYVSIPIFYNKPFIVTIHDLIPYHFPTGKASTLSIPIYYLKLFAYKFIIRQAAKKAKKILTVSSATKKEIIDCLEINPQKIIVTYEGVDRNLEGSSKKLIVKNKYFLYVGNAYPHKNLDRLLEAFKNLISKSPDWQNISLVLVGKEDYFYEKLQKKVQKMNLSKNIIFLQNITDEELSNLYKNAIALVMPSLMEGFGLPALEAMSNKCLVLASDIPSLKEVCRDSAIYFDPYVSADIRNAMEMVLLSEKDRFKKNIQKGEERAKTFSFEKMAKETLRIYENSISLRQGE